MTDIMYSVPSDKSVEKVIVTGESVKDGTDPLILRKNKSGQNAS
jgi:ATP-dependent protease Clp ATPase subunit